jgi:PAS domain S-box-containing protein
MHLHTTARRHQTVAYEASNSERPLSLDTRDLRMLAAVLDATHDGMGVWRSGVWVRVNQTLAEYLGCAEPAAFERASMLTLVHPHDRAETRAWLRSPQPSMNPRVVRFVRDDGLCVELELRLTAIADGDDTFLLVARDLTERREQLRRFVAADRAAAVGALTASVAHGINTPLTQVYTTASHIKGIAHEGLTLLDERWRRGDAASVRTDLRAIIQGIDRLYESVTIVAGITRAMGLLSMNRTSDERASVDLGAVIDGVIDLVENSIRHRARLVREIAVLPEVHGSEAHVGHLLLSVLLGSIASIAEGSARHNEVRVRAFAMGSDACIEVSDTGAARIDADHELDPLMAFERGASVASASLAVCRSLVADLGGTIDVRSQPGETIVTMLLPTVAAVASPPRVSSAAHGIAHGTAQATPRGLVLVIDDEQGVLDLTCRLLGLDHDVVGTTDAHEAMRLIEIGSRFDVILCDLMMPTMHGNVLHAAIAEVAPHMAERMVFVTAGAFSEGARRFLDSGAVTWIEKPYDPDRLRTLVAHRVAAVRAL